MMSNDYEEAREVMSGEWESIHSFTGKALVEYLSGMYDLTDEEYRSLWMEFYGITNDPIMRR